MSERKQVNIVESRAGRLEIATFAGRPELLAGVFAAEIQTALPEFMRHDPTAALYYGDGNLDRYRDYGLAAIDPVEPDRPVARAFSVPFAFPDPARGREALPYGGWDQVIRWAHRDRVQGIRPTAVSALEIMVAPRLQGRGISQVMITRRCATMRAGSGLRRCMRRSVRPRSIANRSPRSPNTWHAAVRMGSRTIPGCAPISASAPWW
jgi:GNAT superfamily N-acetyltransferase